MFGSIRRFGVTEVSQCETEEPEESGFGAYIGTRFDESAPRSA